MSDQPDMLVHLRHISGQLDDLKEDMREIKERLGILESQYASLSRRVDRLGEQVARIEKRLGLVDVP